MPSRQVFRGIRRKIVLAFEVDTIYSGISYSVLEPGLVPEIRGVARFPALKLGASKIPTVIYYDRNGGVRAVGAEATKDGLYEQAEDEEWAKAEWFKLHLQSKLAPGAGGQVTNNIPPLPPGKTVVDVFADFLAYLYECAAAYIKDTHANGAALWESVEGEGQIDFVLSHPNGWEGTQQNEMRKAAIQAGLVPDTATAHARLSFVTEGEAILHYAIQNGLPDTATKAGNGVVIVDAGGGPIDVSFYKSTSKNAFEEVAVPQCHFNGSVFVSIYAQEFLSNFLEGSSYLDDLDHIVRCFDKTTKLRFRDAKEAQYIKFGGTRDNDPVYNIRYGQLKLEGSDVALFFEKSIKCIVEAVVSQRDAAMNTIWHVVLVGDLSASDWVYSQVSKALTALGIRTIRPDDHVNKAVSDGAISFYLDHSVRSRVTKVTYGNFCHIPYDTSNPEHIARKSKAFVTMSGNRRIRDSFDVILPRNTQVSETEEFRKSYLRESESKADFKSASFLIWCYRGNEPNPKWKDIDTDNYTKLCTIEIDLSHLPLNARTKPASAGVYYRLEYEIVLQFGLTELKAQVAWKENGSERRSPTNILYDPDV